MRDILLDINVVVDILSKRMPYVLKSATAFQKIRSGGDKLWLYTGSVHALEYVVASELRRLWIASGKKISFNDALEKAREKLRIFTTGINWLAALAEDGSVFNHEEPEDAQLSQAVVRLGSRALLLTRDKKLLEECPQAISPEKYLSLEPADPPVAFVDLAAQQDVIRPSLERNIHAVLQHGRYIMGPEIKTLESKLAEFSG